MLRARLGRNCLIQEAADLGDIAYRNSRACWDAEECSGGISSSETMMSDSSEE